MSLTIYKYEIECVTTTLEMPKFAKILCVKSQQKRVCLWAIVDTTQEKEKRDFLVIGTGHNVPLAQLYYIGTVMQFEEQLVWHVFEVLKDGH